uniref:Uncharacterized protein n=1 Tax=Arundo donax TaxID=35708 RepID=A0A0A9BDC8_ARUDO
MLGMDRSTVPNPSMVPSKQPGMPTAEASGPARSKSRSTTAKSTSVTAKSRSSAHIEPGRRQNRAR